MLYSLSMLTTAAECDAVLKHTQEQLRELNYQVLLLDHDQEEFAKDATTIRLGLITANSDIASHNNKLTVLPPDTSDVRTKVLSQLRVATNKRASLLERQAVRGSIALLAHELALGRLQAQIAEVTDLAAAVTAHKATL